MMIRRSESVVIHQTNGMSHQQQQSNQMLVDDKCVRGRLYDYCNLFTNKSICS